jgi:uncharacterized protein
MRHPLRAALVVMLCVGGCAGIDPRPAVQHGIAVTGTGRVASPPDAAAIAVGVEARAARLADATAEVDRTMRDVLARVREVGVGDADVQTVSYAINPIAEARLPGDQGSRIVGYRVSNVVQVRTRNVAGVGRILDVAVAAGANVVRDIQLTLADPRRAEAQARALAVQDADAKARQIAAAAGVRLGRLLSVSESPPVRPVARMSLATAAGPVEPGELDVTVTLEARYATEP